MKKIFAFGIIALALSGCGGSGANGPGGNQNNGMACSAKINKESLAKAAVSGFHASLQCAMTDADFEKFVDAN